MTSPYPTLTHALTRRARALDLPFPSLRGRAAAHRMAARITSRCASELAASGITPRSLSAVAIMHSALLEDAIARLDAWSRPTLAVTACRDQLALFLRDAIETTRETLHMDRTR